MTRLSTLSSGFATLLPLAALALTVGLSLPAFAGDGADRDEGEHCERGGPDEGHGRGGEGRRGERPDPAAMFRDNADELGLTDAQLTAIDAIFAEAKPRLEALHDAARAAHDAARADGATAADDDDADAARDAVHEARRATMDAVRAELSDAQWEAARELMPHGRRGGPGGEGRGGEGRDGEGRGGKRHGGEE